MNEIKRLLGKTFRERGYLHEVNRLVLHPLGLALEVKVFMEPAVELWLRERDVALLEALAEKVGDALKDELSDQEHEALVELLMRIRDARVFEAGDEIPGGVWDYRDDPEGMIFGDDLLSAEKAKTVCEEFFARRAERIKRLGYVVQPIPGERVLITNYVDPDPVSVMPDLEFEQ